jgi:hypothetical protein
MDPNVKAAGIVAVGLIISSLLIGGIYSWKVEKDGIFLWRLNRFTGEMIECVATNPQGPPVCYHAPLSN